METMGYLSPESASEARTLFDEFGTAAQEVVRAVVTRLDADVSEGGIPDDVIQAGHEAIFGSLLAVSVGDIGDFETWQTRPPYEDYEVQVEGNEHVDHVVWHAAHVDDVVVAATYQDEREAAIATLRRIVWGRIYRPIIVSDTEDS